jgi:hypothetical protein
MSVDHTDIPALLHDARLTALDWDPPLARLRATFACLRRNADGSSIEDPAIDLDFVGTERIAAYFEPSSIDARPSRFRVRRPLKAQDLRNWQQPVGEAVIAINSSSADFRLETACRIDWLADGAPDRQAASRLLRVHLDLSPHLHRPDGVRAALYIECDSVQTFSHGIPLDLDQWAMEYQAWWTGWKEYWDTKPVDGDDEASGLEKAYIPAGVDPPPDTAYWPPDRPAFQVGETDAPVALLRPIEKLLSGVLSRDWEQVADAYPDLSLPTDRRARALADRYLSFDFGRWIYARRIDSWWLEGSRACVIMRGVEHRVPDGEDPEANEETVVTYGLRLHRGCWIIWTWSQGWPRHGSAPPFEEDAAWREEWGLTGSGPSREGS